ncbi:MAG: hypothetical protein WC107_02415 [Patescibacteria group bacterium]
MAIRFGNVTFPFNVFCATGAREFFGEGYWFHRYFRLLGLTWKETNLASKTITLRPRTGNKDGGNMKLGRDGISPKELFPDCIIPHIMSGHVLNAVGLSGPGFIDLIYRDLWQKLREPFVLSFMAVGKTPDERAQEYDTFAKFMKSHLSEFMSPFVIQVNFGCPNAGLPLDTLRDEVTGALETLFGLGIPLVPNFSPLVPAEFLKELEDTGLCAGFWIANTIPYAHDDLGESIFGSPISPLILRGFSGGGISGPRCLKYTVRTICQARKCGVTLPIIGGNGIQTPWGVEMVMNAGATGIAIGTMAMVPPRMLMMRAVIKTANRY